MFKRSRQLSIAEIEYVKAHAEDPISQICIAISNTKTAVKNTLSGIEVNGKTALPGNQNKRSKIGKRADCGGQFFRSAWEANCYRLIRYLEPGAIIQYEPTSYAFYPFGIRKGTMEYTPDMRVTYPDGRIEIIEVKGGFLKNSDKTRIKRFQKFYPEDAKLLVAITPGEASKTALYFKSMNVPIKYFYPEIAKKWKKIVPGWE